MKAIIKATVYRFVMGLYLESTLPLCTQVKISDEETIAKAAAGDFCIGTLESLPTNGCPGNAGVCLDGNFNHYGEAIAGAAVTAGDRLKLGTEGTGGEQRYIPFVSGTDEPGLCRGVAVTSAAAADDTFNGLFY